MLSYSHYFMYFEGFYFFNSIGDRMTVFIFLKFWVMEKSFIVWSLKLLVKKSRENNFFP